MNTKKILIITEEVRDIEILKPIKVYNNNDELYLFASYLEQATRPSF